MELAELKGVCRLCLKQDKHLEPLFERPALLEKLRVITQLQFAATEGWPAVVCWGCMDLLNSFARFRSKCIESHQRLEAFFSLPDTDDIVIKEEPLDYQEMADPPTEAPPPLETTAVPKEEPRDSVCAPPLFVSVGPCKDDGEADTTGDVAMETGESSQAGEERFYCRITDAVFQEAIAVDIKRRHPARARATDWRVECRDLLETVWVCEDAAAFREPVDALENPDYHRVIDTPMDLRTVKEDLLGGNYESPVEFCKDMRLMFSNSKNYNTNKRSRIYAMTVRSSNMFEARMRKILANWQSLLRRQENGKSTRQCKRVPKTRTNGVVRPAVSASDDSESEIDVVKRTPVKKPPTPRKNAGYGCGRYGTATSQ